MTDRPAPLTPPDCDLRAFRNMPLDIQRFRDSDLLIDEVDSPEVIVAALHLWIAAWHQLPAASLPNDDRALARFAGYGRSLSAWRAVRDAALRGFVLCSDGRLYHEVVAEKANEAWDKRLNYEWNKAKDRHRKAEKDKSPDDRTEFVSFEDWKHHRTPAVRPNKQGRLPLESDLNSAGTAAPSARAGPRESERAGARTRTEDEPNGKLSNDSRNRSAGNEGDFRRNGASIPAENPLKGKEGKGRESIERISQPDPDHNLTSRDDALIELHRLVCEAAGYRPLNAKQRNASLDQVAEWSAQGIDFNKVVLPTIRRIVKATNEPTRTLGRFRAEIAHQHAKANPGAIPPADPPVLEPNGEDEAFRPLRRTLLQSLGASYPLALNGVRFEAVPVEFGSDKAPLYVHGPDYLLEAIVGGKYRTKVLAAAQDLGFTDLWKGSKRV